jgi:hypothetical protein
MIFGLLPVTSRLYRVKVSSMLFSIIGYVISLPLFNTLAKGYWNIQEFRVIFIGYNTNRMLIVLASKCARTFFGVGLISGLIS